MNQETAVIIEYLELDKNKEVLSALKTGDFIANFEEWFSEQVNTLHVTPWDEMGLSESQVEVYSIEKHFMGEQSLKEGNYDYDVDPHYLD